MKRLLFIALLSCIPLITYAATMVDVWNGNTRAMDHIGIPGTGITIDQYGTISATGGGGGSGTVTSITANSPLTGGTITTSGSIGLGSVAWKNMSTANRANLGTGAYATISNYLTTSSAASTYATLGANSNITSLSGLTTALTVGQGGTGTGTAFTQGSIVYAGASGVYSQDNADLFYNPTGYSSGPTFQFGPRASNPTDATFEIYNATAGQQVLHLHNTGSQGSTGGAIMSINAVPSGAAILSGSRLGSLQFGGAQDTSQTLGSGAAINGLATQNWTSAHLGSQIVFNTVPNNSTTRTQALLLDQDQSATFANTVNATTFVGALTGASSTAAKWTTARNLAGNSVDGSANVTFSNKFIVQGTTDSGLSGPQFLGALGTGLVKNTTSTGVLSIGTYSDVVAAFASGSCSGYLKSDGTCSSITAFTYPTGTGIVTVSSGSSWGTTTTPGTGIMTALGTNTGSAGAPAIYYYSGTITLGTGAISSGTCTSAQQVAVTGLATTDVIDWTPNTDPTAVTGYGPSASGSLYIWVYPTSGEINVKCCNNSSGSITPSALTLNLKVRR